MSSTLAHLVCNLTDITGCMRKIQDAHCIVAMALHKPLDPLGPILDSTDVLGSLDSAPAQFRDFPDQQRSRRRPCVQST